MKEPPAKVLTGLPGTGNVMDLKGGDPNLRSVFGKSAAAPALAAAGVPPVGEPYVDCICPSGQSLGWMYLSECTAKRVTSCGGVTPPPVVEPPPPVIQPPPTVQPPAKSPGFLDILKNVGKVVLNQIASALKFVKAIGDWIWNNVLKPIGDWVKSLFGKKPP